MENQQQPEVIRQEMEDTRASLTEKLETLESKVAEKVTDATEAVSDTVETVKETVENVTETVEETVKNVADTFNLWKQTDRHPWAVFGGSVALGFIGGLFSGTIARKAARTLASAAPAAASAVTAAFSPPASPPPEEPRASSSSSSAAAGGVSWLWDKLANLRKLGVGSLMGSIRDLAARAVPESMSGRLAEELDNLTRTLGGEPISGPVLPESKSEDQSGGSDSGQQKEERPAPGNRMNEPVGAGRW